MNTAMIQRSNGSDLGFAHNEGGAMERMEVGALAAQVREEAELKAAITLARQFPRDELDSFHRLEKACHRPAFASRAQYRFPRGGQQITGPSIDLAREIARCWGNIHTGIRIVSADDDRVHIKGYAWDLETGARVEYEDKFDKLVQRNVWDGGQKRTQWVKPDERDLRELVNRRGAILVRNAILSIVPQDVIEDAADRCRATLENEAAGGLKSDREAVLRNLLSAFDKVDVDKVMLETYLGHPLHQVDAEQLANLRSIYRSIMDGNSKRSEYFPTGTPGQEQPAGPSLSERIGGAPEPAAELEPDVVPEAKSESPRPETEPSQPAEPPTADALVARVAELGGIETDDAKSLLNRKAKPLVGRTFSQWTADDRTKLAEYIASHHDEIKTELGA